MDENETPSTGEETTLPTLNSFYDNETNTEYSLEDTVARARSAAASSDAAAALQQVEQVLGNIDLEGLVNQYEKDGWTIFEIGSLAIVRKSLIPVTYGAWTKWGALYSTDITSIDGNTDVAAAKAYPLTFREVPSAIVHAQLMSGVSSMLNIYNGGTVTTWPTFGLLRPDTTTQRSGYVTITAIGVKADEEEA